MIAYLDLPSGISGDMFLGCLVDAGWSIDALRQVVRALGIERECQVESQSVMKGAIRATHVKVSADEGHVHRHLHHIQDMIDRADLPADVKAAAVGVFTRLAEAEAKVHGTTVQRIHFHEVGAIDAIADIVGVCAGVHALQLDRIFASALPLGDGWVQTEHGRLPLPAPATLELLAAAQVPTRPAPVEGSGELVTPTGAALVAHLCAFGQPPLRLSQIGIGAGTRDFPWPNIARLWLGQPIEQQSYVQIETNIDDMNPQLFQSVSQHLLAAGAADVWLTPIQMKKDRPGVALAVMAPADRESALSQIMLRETTTLGLRVTSVNRHELRREMRTLQTRHGTVRVKLKWMGQRIIGATPEYEDCRALADAQSLSLREVHEAAVAAAYSAFLDTGAAADAPRASIPNTAAVEHDHPHPHDHADH
jgi:hypothetical protein